VKHFGFGIVDDGKPKEGLIELTAPYSVIVRFFYIQRRKEFGQVKLVLNSILMLKIYQNSRINQQNKD